MKFTLNQAKTLVEKLALSKITPLIKSSPGIGKSSLVKQIADEHGLLLIDLRLAEMESVDMSGLPTIENGRFHYKPLNIFPLENDPIPDGYQGWLLLLDELTSCGNAIQLAAYRLILDRAIGQNKLHENCYIVAAGNLETDNAIVNPMSTALVSRMAHIEIELNVQDWLNWAEKQGVEQSIIAFINFKPTSLYTFNPDSAESTYACPRTWQMLSDILKCVGYKHSLEYATTLVGESTALEFHSFLQLTKELPKIESIITNPKGIEIPQELSVQWALAIAIPEHMNAENVDSLTLFMQRLPLELQLVMIRYIVRNKKELLTSKELSKVTYKYAQHLV